MKKYLIPIAIYLIFIGLYIGLSKAENNDFLFQPVWDVQHYLDISEIGYQVYPCTPGVDGYAGQICGNSGWYPMWPIIVKIFRPLTGGSSRITFIGLAFIFSLIFFLTFFRFMEKQYDIKAAGITLSALAFGPASFYLITGFPYALFCLLFILYLILIYKQESTYRNIALFVLGLMISLTYPTGILIAVVPAIYYLFPADKSRIDVRSAGYWLKLTYYVLPFILGLFLLWTYFYFKFDDFFLQLHFQEKYHRTWAVPFWIMLKSLFKEPILSPENLSILWFGLIFILFTPGKLKKELWIAGLVLYLFSLTTGTTMSIYRHYLLILPAYMMIGVSSRPLWLKILYIAIGLLISLKILFPLFMAYRLI